MFLILILLGACPLIHAQSLGLQSLSPLGGYWESAGSIQMHHNLGAVAARSTGQADVRLDQGMFMACDWPCADSVKGVGFNEYLTPTLSISPNPTHDILSLQGEAHHIFRYELFSSNGQLIAQGEIQSQQISLENCPIGLYHLRVFGHRGELSYVGKVVKE
ncbi:MAG: hypothetical protein AAFR61_03035 [Bacteroidota bacterium]